MTYFLKSLSSFFFRVAFTSISVRTPKLSSLRASVTAEIASSYEVSKTVLKAYLFTFFIASSSA